VERPADGSAAAFPYDDCMIVLVVDDSPAVRARLVAMIGAAPDVDVREAGEAQGAMAVIAGTAVDVVVLDLHLPQTSGLDLLTRIKALDSTITVIVLTNEVSAPYRRECLLRGADHFFDKSRHFAHAAEAVLASASSPRMRRSTTALS
jgi:DNA-binding NarL/FixJ family response regulator